MNAMVVPPQVQRAGTLVPRGRVTRRWSSVPCRRRPRRRVARRKGLFGRLANHVAGLATERPYGPKLAAPLISLLSASRRPPTERSAAKHEQQPGERTAAQAGDDERTGHHCNQPSL